MQLTKQDTTALKGIAICLMLCHHMPLDGALCWDFANSIKVTAKVCVAMFLFLSGYGLTKQYFKIQKPYLKNTLKFVLQRYVKFFLPYWFCFAIIVLIGNLCGYTLHDAYPATRNTLKCFFYDFWGQMEYNSYIKTWWFNKMILQLYLIFPLLFLLLRKCVLSIIGLATIILLQFLSMKIPGNLFLLTEGGIPAFYLGMLMAKYDIGTWAKLHIHPIALWIIILSIGAALCITIPQLNPGLNTTILLRAFLAVTFAFIYSFLKTENAKMLPFIGKYATTMYLSHSLFLILIPQVLTWAKLPVVTYITLLALSMSFAIMIEELRKITHYYRLQKFIVNLTERI